jgi:MFS family permease
VLGRLFDTVGRKRMITLTYGTAGLLLVGSAIPFAMGLLGAKGVGILFSIIFFIASSAASAAYLTVSEIFPLEIRAFAIAIFYAMGTLVGGAALHCSSASWSARAHACRSRSVMSSAILMLFAAACEMKIGVEAAGKSLESISKPLQSR